MDPGVYMSRGPAVMTYLEYDTM